MAKDGKVSIDAGEFPLKGKDLAEANNVSDPVKKAGTDKKSHGSRPAHINTP
jgi:hypothetical protein